MTSECEDKRLSTRCAPTECLFGVTVSLVHPAPASEECGDTANQVSEMKGRLWRYSTAENTFILQLWKISFYPPLSVVEG